MTRFSFALALSVASASTLACASAPEAPDGLSLVATISRSTIPLGDTATLSFRLKNLTADPISLTFGSSCQVTPFIELDGNGVVVYPLGGSSACFTVITTLTLPGYGEHIVTQTVRGDAVQQASSIPSLPPATYHAYAVLEHNSREIQLRSASVVFVVQ